MKHATNKMITAMLAIVLVFSALAVVLPGTAEAAGSSSGDGKVMFNVIGTDGKYINGASWTLSPFGDEEVLASGTTSTSGLGIAEGIPLAGNLNLEVSYQGQKQSVTVLFDSNAREFSYEVVVLNIDSGAEGAYGYFSAQVSGSKVSFILLDGSGYTPVEAEVKGNSFHIADADLDDGESYTAVLRVPGFEPMMVNVTYDQPGALTIDAVLSTEGAVDLAGRAMVVDLAARGDKNVEAHSVEFNDFDSFDWERVSELSFDVPFVGYGTPGIPLRMQMDTDFDGTVDATELTAFVNFLKGNHPMALTQSFLTVDGVGFEPPASDYDAVVTLGDSSAFSITGYTIALSDSYVAEDVIDTGLESHAAQLTVRYDTPDLDRSYTFKLPAGFEVDSHVSSTQFVEIVSSDYNEFTVDPAEGKSGEKVGMTFKTYGEPTAVGAIEASDYAYAVMAGGKVKHYIVGKEKDVTFTGAASYDANGNPLASYVWDFGDGSPVVTTGDLTVEHSFDDVDPAGYTVTLKVVNNNGIDSDDVTFKVMVDGIAPKAAIKVVNQHPSAGGSVAFNGANSTDDLISAGDGKGVIAKWIWDFGDGSDAVTKTSSGGSVSKVFEDEGTYVVTLTVVDVAGNQASDTYSLEVLPSAKPSLSIQKVVFSEGFEEGQAGTITVTVKNSGDAASTGFMVRLYSISGSSTEELTSKFFDLSVAEDEEVTVEISHTFAAQGEYRLKISVEDEDPRNVASNDFATLIVAEAGWKNIAIFVGVIAVIGVIAALFYYRNRLPGRDPFKKGGPREPAAPRQPAAPEEEEEPRKKAPAKGKGRRR